MTLRQIGAVVVCALALSISAADARPKQARHVNAVASQCNMNNDGRVICQGGSIERTQRHARDRYADDSRVVAHPSGCPRRLFCGCGVSVKAFGKPIRELFLASNYGYYFNQGTFAPGNAAWRPGHVVYILGGTQSDALIYDPNSGHGKTRIHRRDLSRYRIADLSSPKRRLASQ
jgi:hypothetical protein